MIYTPNKPHLGISESRTSYCHPLFMNSWWILLPRPSAFWNHLYFWPSKHSVQHIITLPMMPSKLFAFRPSALFHLAFKFLSWPKFTDLFPEWQYLILSPSMCTYSYGNILPSVHYAAFVNRESFCHIFVQILGIVKSFSNSFIFFCIKSQFFFHLPLFHTVKSIQLPPFHKVIFNSSFTACHLHEHQWQLSYYRNLWLKLTKTIFFTKLVIPQYLNHFASHIHWLMPRLRVVTSPQNNTLKINRRVFW